MTNTKILEKINLINFQESVIQSVFTRDYFDSATANRIFETNIILFVPTLEKKDSYWTISTISEKTEFDCNFYPGGSEAIVTVELKKTGDKIKLEIFGFDREEETLISLLAESIDFRKSTDEELKFFVGLKR